MAVSRRQETPEITCEGKGIMAETYMLVHIRTSTINERDAQQIKHFCEQLANAEINRAVDDKRPSPSNNMRSLPTYNIQYWIGALTDHFNLVGELCETTTIPWNTGKRHSHRLLRIDRYNEFTEHLNTIRELIVRHRALLVKNYSTALALAPEYLTVLDPSKLITPDDIAQDVWLEYRFRPVPSDIKGQRKLRLMLRLNRTSQRPMKTRAEKNRRQRWDIRFDQAKPVGHMPIMDEAVQLGVVGRSSHHAIRRYLTEQSN